MKDANPKFWALLPVEGRFYSDPGSDPGEPGTFDFYISTTGDNDNDGLTPETAWAITALNTKRATYAGLRVGLLDGTYSTGAMGNSDGGNTPALSIAPGSSGSPTVIAAVNPRMAILDDDGADRGESHGGTMGITNGSGDYYVTIDGLKFANSWMHALEFFTTRGTGLIIENCEFENGVGTIGDNNTYLYLQGLDGLIVRNNYFHGLSNSAQTSSVSFILCYGCRSPEIYNNTFEDGYGGVHSKYAGGDPRYDNQEFHVYQNYFLNMTVALRGFDNTDQTNQEPNDPPYGSDIIENNIFESCANAHNNDGNFCANSPIIIRNNTIYSPSGTISGFNAHSRYADNAYRPSFYNNIIYNGGSWNEWRSVTISTSSGAGQLIVFDYNCHGPSSFAAQYLDVIGYPWTTSNYTVETSISAWRALTGQEAGTIVDDPEFAMTGSGVDRFKLGGSSPCLNAGRVGGLSGGATRHMGAWDGVVTQIGHEH